MWSAQRRTLPENVAGCLVDANGYLGAGAGCEASLLELRRPRVDEQDAGVLRGANDCECTELNSKCLTRELTRRRPELFADNKPDPGGRVE